MKVIGTDKNGDEIAEVSATELNEIFIQIRNNTIDEFVEKLLEKAPKNWAGELELGGATCYLSANKVKETADQMKGGE